MRSRIEADYYPEKVNSAINSPCARAQEYRKCRLCRESEFYCFPPVKAQEYKKGRLCRESEFCCSPPAKQK